MLDRRYFQKFVTQWNFIEYNRLTFNTLTKSQFLEFYRMGNNALVALIIYSYIIEILRGKLGRFFFRPCKLSRKKKIYIYIYKIELFKINIIFVHGITSLSTFTKIIKEIDEGTYPFRYTKSFLIWQSDRKSCPNTGWLMWSLYKKGAFLGNDPDLDQWSKITRIMVHYRNQWIYYNRRRIHRLLWCSMIRVFLYHWSRSESSQRNALKVSTD